MIKFTVVDHDVPLHGLTCELGERARIVGSPKYRGGGGYRPFVVFEFPLFLIGGISGSPCGTRLFCGSEIKAWFEMTFGFWDRLSERFLTRGRRESRFPNIRRNPSRRSRLGILFSTSIDDVLGKMAEERTILASTEYLHGCFLLAGSDLDYALVG